MPCLKSTDLCIVQQSEEGVVFTSTKTTCVLSSYQSSCPPFGPSPLQLPCLLHSPPVVLLVRSLVTNRLAYRRTCNQHRFANVQLDRLPNKIRQRYRQRNVDRLEKGQQLEDAGLFPICTTVLEIPKEAPEEILLRRPILLVQSDVNHESLVLIRVLELMIRADRYRDSLALTNDDRAWAFRGGS